MDSQTSFLLFLAIQPSSPPPLFLGPISLFLTLSFEPVFLIVHTWNENHAIVMVMVYARYFVSVIYFLTLHIITERNYMIMMIRM